MKSSFLKYALIALLFILLIGIILFAMRPVYYNFASKLNAVAFNFLNTYTKDLGLEVSYDSLSPSLFSSIQFEGIKLKNAETGQILIEFDKISLKYNIWQIIKGDYSGAIKEFVIDGGTISFSTKSDMQLLQQIIEKFSKKEARPHDLPNLAERGALPRQEDDLKIEVEGLEKYNIKSFEDLKKENKKAFNLTFTISFRNILLRFLDKSTVAELFIKKASLSPDAKTMRNKIEIESSLNAHLLGKKLPKFLQGNNNKISLDISAKGSCTQDFSEASAQLNFFNQKVGEYSISKIAFLLSVTKENLALRMVQNLRPFNIRADYAFKTGDFYARLDSENLDFYDLLPIQANSVRLRRIKGSDFNGVYEVWANSKKSVLSYNVDGGLILPEKLVKGGINALYAFSGTKNAINIKNFSFDSAPFAAGFAGSANFNTWAVNGNFDLRKIALSNGNQLAAQIFCNPLKTAKGVAKGTHFVIPRLNFGEQSFKNISLNVSPAGRGLDFTFFAADANVSSVFASNAAGQIDKLFVNRQLGDILLSQNGIISAESETPNVYSQIAQKSGTIFIDGNYSFENGNGLMANIQCTNLSTVSICKAASFFAKPKAVKSLTKTAKKLVPYNLTLNGFVDTNFKSYSVNVPIVSVMHTKGKDQSLKFSLSGSENLFSLNQIELKIARQILTGSLQVDMGEKFKDIILSAILDFNGIPYNFGGTFVPDSYVSLLGDYGLEGYCNLTPKESKLANLRFSAMPIKISNMLLSASMQLEGDITDSSDWNVHLSMLEIEEISKVIAARPKFSLQGVANNSGMLIENISYIDSIGALAGAGSASWLYSDGIIDSITGNLQMVNPFSTESFDLNLAVSNPEMVPNYMASFNKDYYFTLESSVNDFAFSRILNRQNSSNKLSFSLNASGTLMEPLFNVHVLDSSCSINGYPMDFAGSVLFADGHFSLENINVLYRSQQVTNVVLDFVPQTFSGVLSFDYLGTFFPDSKAMHKVKVPLVFTCAGVSQTEDYDVKSSAMFSVPKDFSVQLAVAGISGDLINVPDTYNYSIVKTDQRFDLYGGIKDEVRAYYELDTGSLSVSFAKPSALTGKFSGVIDPKKNKILIAARNVRADLQRLKGVLTYPAIMVENGFLSGNGMISGLLTDPEFDGDFVIDDFEVRLPMYITDTIKVARLPISVVQSTFRVEPLAVNVKNGFMLFDAFAYFDRWRFDTLSMNVRTLEKAQIPGMFAMNFFDLTGDVAGAITMEMTLDEFRMTGNLKADRVSAQLNTYKKDEMKSSGKKKLDAKVDLQVELGEKCEVCYPSRKNPLVWATVVPKTKVYVLCDTSMGTYSFKGDVPFRGGEVFYIGRSFYLRQGRIVFDENQDRFDPRITFNAEIRERDADNRQVKIILSAENQLLSNLSPTLSASPAKTQAEIMELLGQALTASNRSDDSAIASVAFGLMDYGFQMGVFKQVEKQLRNVLKFDIFSFRIPVVQNSLMSIVNANAGKYDKGVSLGNLLDNTTVYVGKFLGDSLYADAMIQLVYDEKFVNNDNLLRGLKLQPEIGFEMESPFATIRWSIAPDVTAIKSFKTNLWVPYNTVTLSWKFQL